MGRRWAVHRILPGFTRRKLSDVCIRPPPDSSLPLIRPLCCSFVSNLIDWERVEQRYIAATSK